MPLLGQGTLLGPSTLLGGGGPTPTPGPAPEAPIPQPTPENLSAAAARLYESVKHLEVAIPEQGYDPAAAGWPWATLCAALAAPVDDLYDALAVPESPWTPVFDAESGPDWSLSYLANYAGVNPEGVTSAAELRARIIERPARKRGSVASLRVAIIEELTRQHAIRGLSLPVDGFHITVMERYGGPYGILVASWLDETPDAVESSPGIYTSAGLNLVAERTVRAGLVLFTEVIAGGTYGTLAATHADYAEVAAEFTDYADLEADPSKT